MPSTKYKPNKGMKKRFRVSANGKVKHNHCFTSHLRSARTSKRKRGLRRPSILAEGHAKNMRLFMGMSSVRPKQIAHLAKVKELAIAKSEAPAK